MAKVERDTETIKTVKTETVPVVRVTLTEEEAGAVRYALQALGFAERNGFNTYASPRELELALKICETMDS